MDSKTVPAISGQRSIVPLQAQPNEDPCTLAWTPIGTWPSWAQLINGNELEIDAPETITGFFAPKVSLYCVENPDCAREVTLNISLSPPNCNAPTLVSPALQGGQLVISGLITSVGGTQNLTYNGDPTIVATLLGVPAGITIASTGANTGQIMVAASVAAGTYQGTLQLTNGCGSAVNYPVSVTVNQNCEPGEITFPPDGGGGGGSGNCPTTYEGPDDNNDFLSCYAFPVMDLQLVSGDVTAEVGVSGSIPANCIRITGGTAGTAYELSYTVNGESCTYSGTAPGDSPTPSPAPAPAPSPSPSPSPTPCPGYLQGSGASTELPNGGCVTIPLDGAPQNPTVIQPSGATVTVENGTEIKVCGSGAVGDDWVVQLTEDENCLISGKIGAGTGNSCPNYVGQDIGDLPGTMTSAAYGNFDQNITSVTVQSSPGGTINATPGINGQIQTGFQADWSNVPDGTIVFELNGDPNCTFELTIDNEASGCPEYTGDFTLPFSASENIPAANPTILTYNGLNTIALLFGSLGTGNLSAIVNTNGDAEIHWQGIPNGQTLTFMLNDDPDCTFEVTII